MPSPAEGTSLIDNRLCNNQWSEGAASGCLQDNERLRAEITELNDTVFSKNFKAPSAWAEREIKYKMEKKQWEQQVRQNMHVVALAEGRARGHATCHSSTILL